MDKTDAAAALIQLQLGTGITDPVITPVPQTDEVSDRDEFSDEVSTTKTTTVSTTDSTTDPTGTSASDDNTNDRKEGERRIVIHIVRQIMNQEEPTFKKICDANPRFWGASKTKKRVKWQRMRTCLMQDSSINNLIDEVRIHCPEQLGRFKYCLAQRERESSQGSRPKRKPGRPRKLPP